MAISKAEIRGLSIVLLGDFNPIIFQPRWFVSEGLMTKAEADDADVQVVHADVTIFQLPWIGVNVSRERAVFSCTAQPYFERVVGVTGQTFDLLRHTPVRMLGINNEAHIRASSIEALHALGHALAPKHLWNEFFSSPGLQSLAIRQSPRQDNMKGHTEVTVQSSPRIQPGAYVRINEHFVVNEGDKLGADRAVTIVRDHWSPSAFFAERVFVRIEEQL